MSGDGFRLFCITPSPSLETRGEATSETIIKSDLDMLL